jgi:hypothetical protein
MWAAVVLIAAGFVAPWVHGTTYAGHEFTVGGLDPGSGGPLVLTCAAGAAVALMMGWQPLARVCAAAAVALTALAMYQLPGSLPVAEAEITYGALLALIGSVALVIVATSVSPPAAAQRRGPEAVRTGGGTRG